MARGLFDKAELPKVLNKKDSGSDGLNTAYIGRPSKWGNPYQIGRDGTRTDVLIKYTRWIKTQPDLMADARRELKGKTLVCWCAPLACHGHILCRIANDNSDSKEQHER